MSDMSDLDQAVVAAMIKAKEIGVKMLASDCEAILQAAKQSMQGEAVYLVIDHDTLWRQVGKSEYDRVEENNRMLTFTHAPDSAARIAELEQQLEVARILLSVVRAWYWTPATVEDKYRHHDLSPGSNSGNKRQLFEAIDAAIRQIGGVE